MGAHVCWWFHCHLLVAFVARVPWSPVVLLLLLQPVLYVCGMYSGCNWHEVSAITSAGALVHCTHGLGPDLSPVLVFAGIW